MLLCEGFSPFNVDVLYGCTECFLRRTRSQAWRLWKTKIDIEVLRFAWQLSRLLSLNHGFSFGHYLIGFMGSHLSLTDYIARAECRIFACCRQMLQTFGGPSGLDHNMYDSLKQGWTQSMGQHCLSCHFRDYAELPKIQGLDLPCVGTAPY